MSKHTPGPWESKETCSENISIITSPEALGVSVTLAKMSGTAYDKEVKANAYLIASAPELLYACKEALAGYLVIQPTFDRPKDVQPMIDTLRQAIAKAEGDK